MTSVHSAFVPCLLLMTLLCGGCTTIVTPPANVPESVIVYLTDYGKHSSILLPNPQGGYDEFAYGDYDWFALGHANVWTGLRAMLGSPKATLGRRHLSLHEGALDIHDVVDCQRLSKLEVARQSASALETTLDAAFHRSGQDPIHSDFSGLEHVPYVEHYWLFHNCNHATAAWLRALGCRVDGPAILSDFRVAE